MTGDQTGGRGEPLDRRTFLKRGSVAGFGLGLGIDAQAQPGVQYYNFVVSSAGIDDGGYVNKFVFALRPEGRTDAVPFSNCFTNAESTFERQFERGARTYEGLLIDSTESLQLFGGGDAVERLRDLLGGDVNLPEAIDENVGEMVRTRVFVPEAAGPLPTDEGFRAVGGEPCERGYLRLRVHDLPDEVTGGGDAPG